MDTHFQHETNDFDPNTFQHRRIQTDTNVTSRMHDIERVKHGKYASVGMAKPRTAIFHREDAPRSSSAKPILRLHRGFAFKCTRPSSATQKRLARCIAWQSLGGSMESRGGKGCCVKIKISMRMDGDDRAKNW